GDTQCMLAAWRIVPRVSVNQVIAAATTAVGIVCVLRFTALIPETRFAPRGPLPDMPPGMQSPGAWQFTPLPRNGAVTGTRYLTGQTVTTASVTDQVGRQLAGSAAVAGTL